MADEILRYSDLIASDNSIEDLIRLLEKVQSEYSAITQIARQYAANMQADMRRINTATKAGRDELARLTTQTDTLNDVLRGLGAGYDLIDKKLAEVRSGTSEASQGIRALAGQVMRYSEIARGMRNMREIFEVQATWGLADDNLLRGLKELENVIDGIGPELNKYIKSITEAILESIKLQETLDFDAAGRAAKGALVSLRAAFESLTEQYSLFEAKERNSEVGKATKDNMDILRSAITRIQAIMEPLVDKTTELVRAEQGLEVAMSKEGQEAERTKQKIAELNKETRLRGTIANEVSDAEKALKAQVELAYVEWEKLSEAEQKSAQGQDLIVRIASLATILAERNAGLDTAVRVAKNLVKAEQDLGVAMSEEGQAVIRAKQAISELNKETRLQNIEAEAEEGAYDKLKAQLALAIVEWKKMGATERDTTAAGQALTAHIVDLSTQLKGLDNRLRAATESMSQDQIEMAQAAAVAEKLAQAKAKVKIATSDEYKELMALSEEQREANRIAKLDAILKHNSIDSYNGMAAQYEKNKIKLRKLALANRELTEDEKKLVAETYTLRAEMKKFQEMTGVHTLSVGEYGKVWDSFGFSIQQIVREMPAAAQGINNLFIAVANNIPIFVDELMKLRKENAALIAQNRQDEVVSIGKRIAASLFSWQTALMALLTALTMFGDEIIKWVGSLFKGEAAAMSTKKAIKALNKELDSGANGYGENIVAFKKLRDAYVSLNSELKKTEFLEKYKDEMNDLGLAANSVNEADQLFIERTKDVIEAYKNRAKAAAAKNLAEAKYEEVFKKERELAQAQNGSVTLGDVLVAGATSFSAKGRDVGVEAENARLARVERLRTEVAALTKDAESFYKMYDEYTGLANTVLVEEGSDPEGRDLTDRIYQVRLQAAKKYAKSETELIKNEYDKREAEAKASAGAEIKTLEEANRKAMDWLQDNGVKYKALTDEQRQALNDTIIKNNAAIVNAEEKLNEELRLLGLDRQINEFKIQEETNRLMQQTVKKGSIEEYNLRKESIEHQLQLALLENKKLKGTGQEKDEAAIVGAYTQQQADLDNEWAIQKLEHDKEVIELSLQLKREGSAEELKLQKELLDKQLELELEQNKLLADNLRQQEDDIKASYARREKLLEGQYMLRAFQEGQAASRAQYIADNKAGNKGMKSKQLNDYYLGIYDQEQAIALLEEQIWQAEQGFLDWSPEQIAEAKANLVTLNRELDETKDIWNLIGEKGVGGGILTKLGFDDNQIDAFMEATNIVISQIQAIAQAEVEAAEKAVEAAQERVDAAKSAYDAEIEARNNGYANNVATAKAELEQEKKKQKEKQKLLEAAQRNQARIDSITQASSLVTASAEIWSAFGKMPVLAIAAIAAMWSSFAAAKIKARQVTSQEYGEGGLEFLEGGSHASGNDIDLGTVNSRGRRMRAEGGEAMAIINKKNTRKYKALLPGIVDSLNAGNFEDKYLSSLNTSGIALSVNNAPIDISKIEDDVADIRKQNETKYYTADGYLIIQRKNVKRIIKN